MTEIPLGSPLAMMVGAGSSLSAWRVNELQSVFSAVDGCDLPTLT